MLLDAGQGEQHPFLVGMLRPRPLLRSDTCQPVLLLYPTVVTRPCCHLLMLVCCTRKGDTLYGSVPGPWRGASGWEGEQETVSHLSSPAQMCQPQCLRIYNL